MYYRCFDIQWDTDGQDPDELGLPKEDVIELDNDPDCEPSLELADPLSDKYGYCVFGFNYEELGKTVDQDNPTKGETVMIIRCIVAAINANGESDFYFCKVQCTKEQYESGQHYERACDAAEENDYEPKLAYDEYDNGTEAIFDHFVWKSASTYKVEYPD